MSFLFLMAVTAGIAAGAGYLAAKKTPKGDADRKGDGGDGDKKDGEKKIEKRERDDAPPPKKKEQKAQPKKASAFDGLPLALGDVVTGNGEERWLAGALALREDDRLLAVVFVAPEGGEHHAVVAFPRPRKDIYWLRPVTVEAPDEPPATIEIQGAALRRKGRIPVSVERLGQGAPNVGETAIFASYDAGAREVAVVVTSQGKVHAWSGRKLEEGEFDRLGGGGD